MVTARLTPQVATRWRTYEPRGLLSPLAVLPIWPAVTVALNELMNEPPCTPSDPCTGDVLGALVAGAWVTALVAAFAARRVAAAAAAFGALAMALNPDAPVYLRVGTAAAAAWVVAVAVNVVRRRAAQRAYVESVADRVPRPRDPRRERWTRVAIGLTALTASLAASATVLGVTVLRHEREREAAAPVLTAVVARHQPGDEVVLRVGDDESAWEAYDVDDYPVGAEVPVYALSSGARPVAEPYDASYAAFPAIMLWGLALVLAERLVTMHAARAEVPALEAEAYGNLGATVLTDGGRDVMYVHGRELAEERTVVAAGDLVPGGWVALLDGGEVVASGRVFPAGRSRDALREVLWRR